MSAAALAAAQPSLVALPATDWIDLVFPGHAPGNFDRAYPSQPFLAAGAPERFEFAGDERLLIPDLAIASCPCPPLHTAFLWDGNVSRQHRCTSEEARELFRAGYTVSLETGGKIHPGLERLASSLAAELGLERVISPAISVSPAGAGTPVHFDGLEVVVLQIAGSKRWRFAANSQVESPDFPFFPGEHGAGARGGRSSSDGVLPVPPAASEYHTHVLEPGGALFLPRGWWHETEALEDSISATVRLPLQTSYHAVATELVRRLRAQPKWRRVVAQLAPGAGRQRPSSIAVAELVAEALSDLGTDLRSGAQP
ncbi:MAG: hypothetical protein RL685_991 [Pseudomonadota bacterium]|jgi:hypothetical protein